MKIRLLIVVFAIFICAASLPAYESEQELTLPVNGIESMKIRCGSGFLKVEGRAGLKQIRVKASIETKGYSRSRAKEAIEDYLKLSLEKQSGKAVLTSLIDLPRRFSILRNHMILINLEVEVPEDMPLSVDDGSGWIRIKKMESGIRIEDGSGDIDLSDCKGNVRIDDGSGSLSINRVRGDVQISDGSGSISLRQIEGRSIKIDDGSGEIRVEDSSCRIDVDDSSGSITIRDVVGPVTIDDGSGGITINGVEKDVTIIDSGSGGLSIRNVQGRVKK